MARKGSLKCRTGCLTCRIRRVKCDESKPDCRRCKSMKRKCDGYPQNTVSSYGVRWPGMTNQSFNGPGELRALQFFCSKVASSLSEPFNSHFWSNFVLQCSNFESAVCHSVIAISSLYEDFYHRPEGANPEDNNFALHHYNTAIKMLAEIEDVPLVLLVCILFICIEYLRDNVLLALRHTQHGLLVLENATTLTPGFIEHLKPIFRRLSVYILFCGVDVSPRSVQLTEPIPNCFSSLSEARIHLDALHARAYRFTLHGYHGPSQFRKKLEHPIPSELLQMQAETQNAADMYQAAFTSFRQRNWQAEGTEAAMCALSIRLYTCLIFIPIAFIPGQMGYDTAIDIFRVAIRDAEYMNRSMKHDNTIHANQKFRFEVVLMPYLYTLILKCRDLATRLQGLQVLRNLGCSQERGWRRDTIYRIAKRVVEIEHGIVLDLEDKPVCTINWNKLPSENKRLGDDVIYLYTEEAFYDFLRAKDMRLG